MAEDIVSTEIENSPMFLALEDKYRQSIMDDTTLSKAAKIGAKQELLFRSKKPAAWKVPRAKLNSRLLLQWTSKARSMTPAGVNMGGDAVDVDDTPMKKMVDRIIKNTTPAPQQGALIRPPLQAKCKLKIPQQTPLKPPAFMLPPKQKKSLPKASPAVTRSKSKKKGAQERCGTSVKELGQMGLQWKFIVNGEQPGNVWWQRRAELQRQKNVSSINKD